MRDFWLHGQGKAWFSLSSRIHDWGYRSWIRAALTRAALVVLTGSRKVHAGLSAQRKGKSVIFPFLTDPRHDDRSWIRAS
ncbi:MAG: hypothetical protein JXR72_06780, partial [Proteobacteria bacterium]|nr:hypothetical protein [Pseudomonadota bacterium]